MAEIKYQQNDQVNLAAQTLPEEEEWFDLLPIEKKLISYSLGLGIVLLVIFIFVFKVM